MNPRVARHLARTFLSLAICISLLSPGLSTLVSEAAQDRSAARAGHPAGHPRPGKPEGDLPDLDDVQNDSHSERAAPPPLPSTVRSHKNPTQPWDGKRVGEPGTNGTERGSAGSATAPGTQRAHARRRPSPPPPVPDDQLVQNFFSWVLVRNPTGTEPTYWYDQLRVGYVKGPVSLRLAAVELGKTLFESAEYAARNRSNHWYVYDLYKSYLMRDPDAGGWAYWEALVPTIGRESVRRGFEESTEFATLMSNVTPNGLASGNAASLITARVEPRNQPGHGLLARDAVWSVPLLSLPGRSGLDLGLALSYSSQVWTRSGPYIYFDEDNGFPSPGFRLGFPTVQRKTFNAQTGKNAYLLLTAAGRRVELRQVESSNVYEAADSSYLQLTENGTSWLVRSTDGTQLTFTEVNNEYRCTQVKDRNGNYLTVNYNASGRITNITDTLGRLITFNYDGNANLISITQSWNGQPSHQWVSFGWGTRNLQSSFSGAAVVGTANGAVLPVITQVALNDTSYFTFDYTNSLQVSVIRNYFGAIERNAVSFTYETPAGDVPRLLDSRVSARNWTGVNGVPAQLITQYSLAGDGACVMTAPDGTSYKEYYGSGWQKGLTIQSEVWAGAVRQKWTTTAWTQDDTAVGYEQNPRVTETNVYDSSHRRRTVIEYGSYAQFGLPYAVREFAADGTTELRQTFTDYNLSPAYLNQRIIGLVSQVHVSNVAQWQAKVSYSYDDPARLEAVPAAATQHDTNFGTSFTARGNVTAVSRWDVTDSNNAAKKLTTYTNYNTTGNAKSTTDPGGHVNSIGYADSFSDSLDRNTFAYPTTVTDADGYSSTVQYNFDFGATTRTQSPAPAGQSQGAIQTMTYNNLGQLERVTTTNNGAYKRFWYGPDYTASYATVNTVADELYAIEVVDGLGRVIGAASNHPGSTGGYRLVNTIYNLVGQAVKQSNPTEITNAWAPSGDDAAGLYYTQQTYDWKGRPLVTTNPDGTTREASYAGCGCAGGNVVTLTDEGTISNGVAKRRQQKIYSDMLGRSVKTEILNWENGSVYSATVNTYNARDQITDIKQYAGPEAVGNPHRDTTMTYDGHGRLKTKHMPQESVATQTTWTYNADDTVNTITDPRGAVSTFGYAGTNRGLVKTVAHTLSGKPTINVAFDYDAAGNRVSMSDQSGTSSYTYNQLSQLTAEARTLGGTTYSLSYQYNLADQLKKMTYPGNMSINYGYDTAGRLNGVTGSDTLYQGISQYASGFTYRASGARKTMTDGANRTSTITYDARMRPLNYQISGGVMNQTYEYYNDGSMRLAHNTTDNNFDRLYEYDQAGRLTYATTGGIVRGDLGSVPYNETFGYNAWGDTTSRWTETWSQDEFADAGTFTNGRRDGWEYEADGNIKTIDTRTYSYDAAGNRIMMAGQLWSGSSYSPTSTNNTFDGDGQRVQEVLSWPSIFTTKYLRSSVLGGEIAQEINSAGQTISYVYLPDGTQLSTLIGFPKWRHETPAGTGLYETFQSGFVNRVEFDPVRANVGLTAPPPPDTNGGDGDIGGNHNGGPTDSRFSDMANPAGGCYNVGGVDLPCTWSSFDVFDFFVWGPARQAAAAVAPDLPGVWVGARQGIVLRNPNPFDDFLSDTIRTTTRDDIMPGHWIIHPAPAQFVNISSAQNSPQNSGSRRLTADETSGLRSRIEKMLNTLKCAKFLNNLLNRTAKRAGQDPVSLKEILNTFDKIDTQNGFIYDNAMSNAGEARGGISSSYPASVALRQTGYSPRPGYAARQIALAGLHEVIHHLRGGRGYLDLDLAQALGFTPRAGRNVAETVVDASVYWGSSLINACDPGEPRR